MIFSPIGHTVRYIHLIYKYIQVLMGGFKRMKTKGCSRGMGEEPTGRKNSTGEKRNGRKFSTRKITRKERREKKDEWN